MKYAIDDIEYTVIITRKNNKNTYLRIGEGDTILISTSYFTTKKQLWKILEDNEKALQKMLVKKRQLEEKNQMFYFLGKKYDIIWMQDHFPMIMGNNLYVSDEKTLQKWYLEQVKTIFLDHLNEIYPRFKEEIPYPKLKLRKMKTRWGVCNRRDNSVTLNTELLRYDLEKLDYVIVHELAHFVEFNHSASFWGVVSKYCKDYKRIRKELKE